MNKRPLAVTIIAWVYIVVGAVGFTYHLTEFQAQPFDYDFVWVELVRILAIVAGVWMLRGANWARWLALAWIAFHVFVSVLDSWPQLAMHSVLCVVIGYFLLKPQAARYFRTMEGSGTAAQ